MNKFNRTFNMFKMNKNKQQYMVKFWFGLEILFVNLKEIQI